jgi:hypothetical protein
MYTDISASRISSNEQDLNQVDLNELLKILISFEMDSPAEKITEILAFI